MVAKKIGISKPIKMPTANVKRLGYFGASGQATHIKQEKRVARRYKLPRKHDLGSAIEPMAIAILESERHKNQISALNHGIEIDSKGRWIIDGETVRDSEDNAGEYIRTARKLDEMGFGFRYVRNHPTITDPQNGELISITLNDAKRIIRNGWD